MCARSKLTKSGDVSYYNQSTALVTQRSFRESSKDSNGERKNDPANQGAMRSCSWCFQPGDLEGGFSAPQIYVLEVENDLATP
jgi:hypothetical protein